MGTDPLTVVTWRWKPPFDYRSKFGPETVNVLRRMVARHYPHPHTFVCVTDDPDGIDPEVTVLKDFGDFADLRSQYGPRYPACYRRLRMFHPGAAEWFGQRFVSLDLDMVITGDLSRIWHRSEDVVLWGNTNPTTHYNGSMLLMTAGARPAVWTDFDPRVSPIRAKAAGQHGSDQGWISYRLGKGEATWTQKHGVYSYRNDIRPHGNRLPPEAKMVVFHGEHDPWTPSIQAIPWVKGSYR
jgi:hypothetical protein